MKTKIFKNLFLLSALSIIITTIMIAFIMYDGYFDDMKAEVRQEAQYIARAVETDSEYLERVRSIQGDRITRIDADGTVLFDNRQNSENMENHSKRPEVIAALDSGEGESSRMSDTLGENTYYYAVKLNDGTIIRVANTTDSVYGKLADGLPYIVIICFAMLVVASTVGKRQTNALVSPINRLNLEEPLENRVYEELSPLLRKLEQQKTEIEKTYSVLKKERKEFNSIIENMNEGLIVLNASGEMLTVNRRAAEIFGKSGSGHYLTLNRSAEFREVAEKAMTGVAAEGRLKQEGRLYHLMAAPTFAPAQNQRQVQGAVVLILDITETEETERMRREFSANVSHELRTPLTSISGYAEIIREGIAKPEDIKDFSDKIYTEAKRMIALVDDIMKLSRLDEDGLSLPFTSVDMKKIALEVTDRLKSKADKESIELELDIPSEEEEITVTGVAPMLEELVFNLCDNAIKYNKKGGKVKIRIQNNPVRLTVSDTGIGIAPEHQSRIFERFYRVDKSHSKETGGTGLGLSIVKHIVKYHNASIKLQSEQEKGTKIEVEF